MTSILRRDSELVASRGARELAIGLAAGIAAVAACTAVIYPLKHVAPADSLGVVYILAVLLISTTWGVWLGVITAVESALAFDYFHLPPVESLSIRHGSEWVGLVTFLITAILGGYVARVARSRSELVASRARIIAAADAARERLARDLHDGTQQRLVTTVVDLQLADQQFDRDAPAARELLQAALTEAGEALTELRELAHGVHPTILTNRDSAQQQPHSPREAHCQSTLPSTKNAIRHTSRRQPTSSSPRHSPTPSSTPTPPTSS